MKFSSFHVFASALLLSGCVNGPGPFGSGQMHHDWENFEGEQRDWPTSTEAFCRRLGGLEIYGRGQLPRRPYLMLGRLKLGTNPIRDRETPDQALVRICREHGADGVALFDQKSARTEYGTLVTVWWYDAFRYRPETTSPATQLHDPAHSLGINQVAAQQTEADRKLFESIKTEAELGDANSQCTIAVCFENGLLGVKTNQDDAVKWFRKAAENGNALAQSNLGLCYFNGTGVKTDFVEAIKWLRKASQQNEAGAQGMLGIAYEYGQGVPQDYVESAEWYRKAAEQGVSVAQFSLGLSYAKAQGVPKDYVQAYKWFSLAAAQGIEQARNNLEVAERRMTKEQVVEAQQLARDFKPRMAGASPSQIGSAQVASGTGFFIAEAGFLVTNEHVVRDAAQVRLVTSAGLISAKVVKVDAANDLALLKAEGKFAALPVAASRAVKLGGTVASVGFPNIGLQGFAPKLAKGEIASLSGAGDDARYFQISVPVQPGNSGGALVDERGNVVGVVSAKLSLSAALKTSGALPENVNYAIKSSYLLSFLESVPEVSAKLKEPNTKERKFEDVVKDAEQAAVLVLVY